uniref:Protein BCAP isoform X1 n=1 Tax=Geotrypetes seraphini TaxID=260995 RepID=A0A6P8NAP5_GEOSA|nr:protein BCAP isoform X1 [Geotrypetes seraphini]XP_033772789.1 protein BCAP isoform X1 [Geotrypetes seraphini]XP_033772792.1 protein BCAP isoform X1 [Geotrypetes seraphini]XP_033772793.1 protein BCAP isoform X1 [Geotrypetes seraphini]XP_033772794.1 protein BCAP isoform X1 [Geotrypetes seraphini]
MLEELSSECPRVEHQTPLQQSLDESSLTWLNREMVLLAKLHETEMATRSAEILMSSLREKVAEMPSAANLTASDVLNITKEKNQFLRELETFTILKGTLEHLLKRTEYRKFSSKEINNDIENLLERVFETETENMKLKNKVLETENYYEDLSRRLQLEKDKTLRAKELSVSIEATHNRLQNLLQKKEAKNDRLTAQMQDLEMIIAKRKLEIKDMKCENSSLKEKTAHDKEALKKAIRTQKQRAQHFKTIAKNVPYQIRAQDNSLSEALSACNIWKSRHERAVEEKTELEIQFKTLTKHITGILADLQKIQDDDRSSKEQLLGKIHVAETENSNIVQENENLKASIGALENKNVSIEDELLDLQDKTKKQKSFVERYEAQVYKIQAEVMEIRNRLEKSLNEKKLINEQKNLEIEKVEAQMEANLDELEHVAGFLRAAEQRLQECQESLLIGKRKYTAQSKTYKKLQAKVDANNLILGNQSWQKTNVQIQRKLIELNQKFENMVKLNQELKGKLANQEKNLHHSEVQLFEKSKECSDLTRLLEAAVYEGKKQVFAEKKKITLSEKNFQKKVMDLEIELSMKKEEQKQITYVLSTSEKYYHLQMKDMQHSLDQTENQNQGAQKYVQFLKATYATMFE